MGAKAVRESDSAVKARVFLSYKRNVDPDQYVVAQVFRTLESRGYTPYIDQEIRPGDNWAAALESNIRQADYLVVFLTEVSAQSEMVRGEIELAREHAAKSGGKPKIVPVRLAFTGQLPYPLSSYLDGIQYAMWRGDHDTDRLIWELEDCFAGREVQQRVRIQFEPRLAADPHPAYAASLPPPGGTLEIDDPWYIERNCDRKASKLVSDRCQTMTIKGPRQMGKSSLLLRIMAAANKAGKRPVLLDFQILDEATRSSAELYFRRFADWIAEELDISARAAQFWDKDAPHPQNCSRFMEKQILSKVSSQIMLAIDEADILFSTPYCADFFAMLRKWHNDRANFLRNAWKGLDLVLVTSTEPYLFINRVEQSPFNVGEILQLDDFYPEQVNELNRRHGSPLFPPEVERLTGLLAGHPYLTRKALYSIAGATASYTPDELFRSAHEDSGPFGDHLRHYLLRLQNTPDLIEALTSVVHGRGCDDVLLAYRLRSAGLVKQENRRIVPRCKLYGDYFRDRLRRRA